MIRKLKNKKSIQSNSQYHNQSKLSDDGGLADSLVKSKGKKGFSDIRANPFQIKSRWDKSVIGFQVPQAIKSFVEKNISKISEKYKSENNYKVCDRKTGYKMTFGFKIPNKKVNGKVKYIEIIISYMPINDHRAFFLIDFNASRIKKTGKRNLKWIITKILGKKHHHQVLRNSYFTHLEYAADIFGVNINDILVYRRDSRRSKVYTGGSTYKLAEQCIEIGSDGCIETMYLDSQKSSKTTKVYNKKIEINKRRKKRKSRVFKPYDQEITRVETRYKNAKIMLSDIPIITNPALHLFIFNKSTIDDLPGTWDAEVWKACFLDSCARRGFQNAIRLLPINYQRRLKRWLSKVEPFTNLEEIFEQQREKLIESLEFLIT